MTKPVFGTKLPSSVEELPEFVIQSIEFLKLNGFSATVIKYLQSIIGIEEEGIFRLSGENTIIQNCKNRINNGKFCYSILLNFK